VAALTREELRSTKLHTGLRYRLHNIKVMAVLTCSRVRDLAPCSPSGCQQPWTLQSEMVVPLHMLEGARALFGTTSPISEPTHCLSSKTALAHTQTHTHTHPSLKGFLTTNGQFCSPVLAGSFDLLSGQDVQETKEKAERSSSSL
jgi:hypothetical protein